jgi:hypothetical protein
MGTDGALVLGKSTSSGAESTNSVAGVALPTVWGSQTLFVNLVSGGTQHGYRAWRSLRIAAGVQTMDYMRAA